MKNFKVLVLLVTLMAAAFGVKAQPQMTVAERSAQKAVVDYLKHQGFETEIDNSDNSVLFKQSDVLYWITFKGNTSGVLYTLHRRPIKLNGNDKDAVRANIRKEKAIAAANMVNRKEPYKVTVTDGRVNFSFPVFSSTPAEYISQLTNVFNTMKNAKQEFDKAYEGNAKLYTDSIHNYWASNDTSRVILPQKMLGVNKKNHAEMAVSKVEFASINGNGKSLVPYGGQLLQPNVQYLSEKIAITPTATGLFYIGVKLYDPDGKLIVANKESEFTTVTEFDVKKANKSYEVELEPFGTSNYNFWRPGSYTIEIYDADVLVRKDVFLIAK